VKPLLLLLRVNALQSWRRLKSVRKQSRLLTAFISLFLGGYIVLSFLLFYKGLKFVASFPGLGTILTERLLFILFAFLFFMLLLSNLIIGYTNLFNNRETAFLLNLPVPFKSIFRWKFIESTVLASWGFLFLIAPLLVAYGLTRGVPWHFYLATLLLIGVFICLPAVLGCALAIVVGRFLGRRSFQITLLATGVLLLLLAAFWWKGRPATDAIVETRVLDVLDQLLVKTSFAQFPFLPSYWLASSITNWADGVFRLAIFFALVLLSYSAFLGTLAFTSLGNLFFDSASAVQSRGALLAKRRGRAAIESTRRESFGSRRGIGTIAFPFVRPDARALALKDILTFWRDTSQWGQSVVLFGLLGLYVLNLRHFTQQLSNPFWVNLISYLNLGACSLNLATVTTRFVFPQFSLEGRRLWIIGMAPMGLVSVVKTKYWLACVCSLAVTLTLIIFSCWSLQLPWDRMAFFGAVVTVMTFALNGLALGLGVLYPNFRESNPSKIVSGFGGTLCLILSFLYILATILILGFGTARMRVGPFTPVLSVAAFAALSFAVGWLPLKFALRNSTYYEV
jgi:ABC-2 type transport system permease protein